MVSQEADRAEALTMGEVMPELETPREGPAPADPPIVDEVPAKRRRARRSDAGRPRASKQTTPPADGAPAAPRRDSRPRSHTRRRQPLAPRVESMHIVVGMGVAFVPSPVAKAVGTSLADNAKPIGEAWEQYAKANPQVAEWLERLLVVSDLGILLGAYLPVIVAGAEAAGAVGPLEDAGETMQTHAGHAPPAAA